MAESLILLILAAAPSVYAPRSLRPARWMLWAPKLGITVWLGVSLATLAVAFTGAMAAALCLQPVSHGLADLLHACLHRYRVHLPLSHPSTLVGALGTVATPLLPAWVGANVLHQLRANARARRHHLRRLALAAEPASDGVLVVPHPRPALYCLPGRARQIVVTTAALQALRPAELAAAVAHERAHLRGRHHLLTSLAQGLAAALPLPLYRSSASAVAELVELLSDDEAIRRHDAHHLATAVVAMAGGRAPEGTLGVGDFALRRLHRLLDRPPRLGRLRSVGTAALVVLAVVVPAAMAVQALRDTRTDDLCLRPPATVPTPLSVSGSGGTRVVRSRPGHGVKAPA